MLEKYTPGEKMRAAKVLAIGAFVLGNLGLVAYASAGSTNQEVRHHSAQSVELMAEEAVGALEVAGAAKFVQMARESHR